MNKKSGLNYKSKNGIPVYHKKSVTDKYYFNENYSIYSDKITDFALECNSKSGRLVIERINTLFDFIFIDEVQDLAGHDLILLSRLFDSKSQIILAGDPRQATYNTHLPLVNKKYKEGKIIEYIKEKCNSNEVDIDTQTLKNSYRNTKDICEYSNKLFPEYPLCKSLQKAHSYHEGVFLIKPADINFYLDEFGPLQLRYNRNFKGIRKNYDVLNFGESKGKTINRTLIYPTKDIKDWIRNGAPLSFKTKCQFYVALTRTVYSAGIVWDEEELPNDLPVYDPYQS